MAATRLYLVPTPIGNLQDFTFRAVEVLKTADLILAEDTRTSGILLKHYDIHTPMMSFHAHNEHNKLAEIIGKLKDGQTIAQISDAGTPGISDPGFLLVREALAANIALEVLPGATAFLPALIKSGFPSERFVYEGFLPQKKGRKTRMEQIARHDCTTVLYESPYRILKLLDEIRQHMGTDTQVSVSRELSKKFEETQTGTVDEVLAYFKEKERLKGEFVVVIKTGQ